MPEKFCKLRGIKHPDSWNTESKCCLGSDFKRSRLLVTIRDLSSLIFDFDYSCYFLEDRDEISSVLCILSEIKLRVMDLMIL